MRRLNTISAALIAVTSCGSVEAPEEVRAGHATWIAYGSEFMLMTRDSDSNLRLEIQTQDSGDVIATRTVATDGRDGHIAEVTLSVHYVPLGAADVRAWIRSVTACGATVDWSVIDLRPKVILGDHQVIRCGLDASVTHIEVGVWMRGAADLNLRAAMPPAVHPTTDKAFAVAGAVIGESGVSGPRWIVACYRDSSSVPMAVVSTDEGGHFKLVLHAGRYHISASAADGSRGSSDINVSGDVASVNIVVRPGARQPCNAIEANPAWRPSTVYVEELYGDTVERYAVEVPAQGGCALPMSFTGLVRVCEGEREAVSGLCGVDGSVWLEPGSRAPHPITVRRWLQSKKIVGPSVADRVRRAAERLRAELAVAAVVAVGESTHGTHEHQQLRFELLRQLVETGNLRVLLLETDMVHALDADSYIQGGPTDVSDATSALPWIFRTSEMRDTLEWLRDWNRCVPDNERVHIAGLFAVPSTEVESWVAGMCGEGRTGNTQVTTHLPSAMRDALRELSSRCVAAACASDKCCIALRILRLIDDREALRASCAERFVEEHLMALGVQLALAQADGGQCMVWAHNVHIETTRERMGGMLQDLLGAGYVALGVGFGEGTFSVDDEGGTGRMTVVGRNEWEMSAAFEQGDAVWLVPLAPTGVKAVDAWLREPRSVWEIGSRFTTYELAHRPRILGNRFAFYVYMGATTPTTPMNAYYAP